MRRARFLLAVALAAVGCRSVPVRLRSTDAASQRMPIYPEILRTTNVEGAVELRVPVDTSGRAVLAGARVLRSGHQVFTWSVRDAVRGWRFESARRGRHRTSATVRVTFTFTLTDEPPCPGRVHESAAGQTAGATPRPIADFDPARLQGRIVACRYHAKPTRVH